MFEKEVEIKTNDGKMMSTIFHEENNLGGTPPPAPVVILYMDAPGIREELFDFCRKIAKEGYYVLLPDMYYRHGKVRYVYSEFTPELREDMFEKMNSLSNQLVMEDTKHMLQFLETEDQAKSSSIGCIGYCMSGQYVVSAAGTFPDHFAAAASLYGVGIVTEEKDSPHLLANKIKGELYLGFAEKDIYVPKNVIPDLKEALDKEGVTYQLDIWPNTEHGFCFPERAAYVQDAADKVWQIVFNLFKRKLQ